MPFYFCAVMHSFACGDYTFIVFCLCFPGRYHFPMLQTSRLFSSKGCWIHCGGGPTRKRKKKKTTNIQHSPHRNRLTTSPLPSLQHCVQSSFSSSADHLESMDRNARTMAPSVTPHPPTKDPGRDWRCHSSELPGVIDFMQSSINLCSHRVTSAAPEFWALISVLELAV